MLRDILESMVRWYFKRYHPTKLITMVFDNIMSIDDFYEFGDVLTDSKDQHILYIGKEVYIKLYK